MAARAVAPTVAGVLSLIVGLSATQALVAQHPDDDAGHATLIVRVTDDNGRPVRGLQPEDFVARMGDRAVPIAAVRELVPRSSPANDGQGRDPGVGDVASNARDVDETTIVAVVLVDDVLIAPSPANLSRVQRLLEDLGRALGPNDVVAVTTSSRSHLAYDFRGGAGARALDARSVVEELLPTDTLPRAVASTTNARRSLTAVRNAFAALATSDLPGHRVLIYVSQGARTEPWQPVPNDAAREEFEQAAAALARTLDMARETGVVVHAVDPRELRDSVLTPHEHAMLRALADGSGGIAHLESSGLRSVAHRTVEDGRAAYEIRLAESDAVGGTTRLELRTTRPGVEVRTVRRNAFRLRAGTGGTPDRLASIVRRGLPFSSVPMEGRLEVIRPAASDTVKVHLIAAVRDAGTDGASAAAPAMTALWAAVDAHGGVVASGAGRLTAQSDGSLHWSDELNLPWEATRVIVGTEASDGRLGTLPLDLVMPARNADVIVGGVGIATSVDEVLPRSPATVSDDLRHAFDVGQPLQVIAPVSWRESRPRQVSVAVVVRRDDEVVARIPRFLDSADRKDGYHLAALSVSLADLDLAAGRYVVEVEARLRSGHADSRTTTLTLR